MKHLFLSLFLLVTTVFCYNVSAVNTNHDLTATSPMAIGHQITVNDFLAFDFKGYQTMDGKKLKWGQRVAMSMAQKSLAKKVKKGKIDGASTLDLSAAVGGNNTYGLLSIIFSIVGLFVPYLGLAMIIAGLVLGIIGIKRDANPTMAIIGTAVSAAFLLLVLIAIVALASWGWY